MGGIAGFFLYTIELIALFLVSLTESLINFALTLVNVCGFTLTLVFFSMIGSNIWNYKDDF